MRKDNQTGVLRKDPNYQRVYRLKHLKKYHDADKRYADSHPEKIRRKGRLYSAKYRKEHPEARIRENFGDEAAKFWLAHYREGCKKCGAHEKLSLHHIDHDKTNNKPENLAILCMHHHMEIERYYDEEDRPIIRKWFNNWLSKSHS